MNDFVSAIREDPQVRVKINDMLDKYNRKSPKYQSKIGYDTLIQNVILKELINIMGCTITDLDIEIKLKISRIKYLENKSFQRKQIIEMDIIVEYKYYYPEKKRDIPYYR